MKLLNKIKLKSRLTCLVKHKDKRLKPIKAFTLNRVVGRHRHHRNLGGCGCGECGERTGQS